MHMHMFSLFAIVSDKTIRCKIADVFFKFVSKQEEEEEEEEEVEEAEEEEKSKNTEKQCRARPGLARHRLY